MNKPTKPTWKFTVTAERSDAEGVTVDVTVEEIPYDEVFRPGYPAALALPATMLNNFLEDGSFEHDKMEITL